MRLSENGWSNDLPDKPGWYLILSHKEWEWYDFSYPYPVRVDYVNGELMVVEDPTDEHEDMYVRTPPLPAPLEFDPAEDQSWMRRAYKPIQSLSIFDSDKQEQPDVSGIRGYAPDELDYRPEHKRERSEQFKRVFDEAMRREDERKLNANPR